MTTERQADWLDELMKQYGQRLKSLHKNSEDISKMVVTDILYSESALEDCPLVLDLPIPDQNGCNPQLVPV